MHPIAKYLDSSGLTQSEFARRIGVSQSMVYQMITGLRPVPERVSVRIEKETAGSVSRKDLFPDDWADIWPELATRPTKEASHA